MNNLAIFSDGTSQFRRPEEPNAFTSVNLRLRVDKRDALVCSVKVGNTKYQMREDGQDDLFRYFAADVMLTDQIMNYCFEIIEYGTTYYYDRMGVTYNVRDEYLFSITPGFSTPDWAKGAVMYQILVDRFCNGDTSNDVVDNEYYYINTYVKGVKEWDKAPENFDVARFYGGDLEGVRQKLYYLKSIGVEVIYFNPIFVSPSNHKYDISDYDYVDPHYTVIPEDADGVLSEGDYNNANAIKYKKRVTDKKNLEASNEFFAKFVEEAHSKGLKVILDGVFNHCGSFNKWMDREGIYDESFGYPDGAYKSADSPYRNYFQFFEEDWPNNHKYDGWWGNDTLPKLNYEGSNELYDYIISIGKKWVSPPYNCDGWRLDVAADLGHSEEFNHKFWNDFRKAVKQANPNAVVLAEHYGDPSRWLDGYQWDTIMNYDAFMEPLSYFLTGMEKHSDKFEQDALGDGVRFKNTMMHFMTKMKTPSLMCSMNQLSNHDHSRFLTRTNHKAGRVATLGSQAAGEGVDINILRLASMIQFTWPGAPTLYYGDEAGVVGFTDPDNRRTYPWGNADYDLIDYHRDLIMIHRESTALRKGSLVFLDAGKDFIAYARFDRVQIMVIAINMSSDLKSVDIPVWIAGVPMEAEITRLIISNQKGYSILPAARQVKNGILHIDMKPQGGVVYRYEI